MADKDYTRDSSGIFYGFSIGLSWCGRAFLFFCYLHNAALRTNGLLILGYGRSINGMRCKKIKEGYNRGVRKHKTMDPFCIEQGLFRIHNVTTQKKEEIMTGQGIDFINFVIDALDNHALMKQALTKETPKELYDFFQEKGYLDVPFKDCASILKASKDAHGKGVNEGGHPVKVPGEEEPPPGY